MKTIDFLMKRCTIFMFLLIILSSYVPGQCDGADGMAHCCQFNYTSDFGTVTRTMKWNSSTDFTVTDTFMGDTTKVGWGPVLNNSDIPCLVA